MKLTIGQRVDVAVRASSIAQETWRFKDPDIGKAPWHIIGEMKSKSPNRDSIIGRLRVLGSAPIEEFPNHHVLADLMYGIAEIEKFLDLPPTEHGLWGYPPLSDTGPGMDPYYSRAREEFEASRPKGAAA